MYIIGTKLTNLRSRVNSQLLDIHVWFQFWILTPRTHEPYCTNSPTYRLKMESKYF